MTSNTYVQVPGNVLQHLYVNGCQPSYTSTTTVTIGSGQVRDSTDSFDIAVMNPLVVNFAVNGVNGLDTGAFAASTGYYLFVLYDQSQANGPVALASLSPTAPTIPSLNGVTFSHFRMIGWVLSDGSTHLLPFYIANGGGNPFYQWDAPIQVLNAGASGTAADVALQSAMPTANYSRAQIRSSFVPHAAADTASIKPHAATNYTYIQTGIVASVAQSDLFEILPTTFLTSTTGPTVTYILSSATSPAALSLWVTGFGMAL